MTNLSYITITGVFTSKVSFTGFTSVNSDVKRFFMMLAEAIVLVLGMKR